MKRELPDRMLQALRTGVRPRADSYGRDYTVFSIGMSMYQHGWGCEEFIQEILDPKNLAGEKVQDMPSLKARKKLDRDWDRIIEYVDANPPMKGREVVEKRLGEALDVVSTARWGGRTGNTDRHVLLTILALAHDVGTYTPAFSTRTLAMVANKRQETVTKSLKRLRESGLLAILTPSTYRKTAVYEVKIGTLYTGSLTSNPGGGLSDPLKSVRGVLGHDLFTRGCLGDASARLWTQLHKDRGYTVSEMAKHLGLSENSCRNSAKRLVSVGLADVKSERPAKFTMVDPMEEDLAGLDLLLMEMDTWAMPYGEAEEFLDYTDHMGKGEKRSTRYEHQQEARRLRFTAYFDEAVGDFVDRETGEIIERAG